VTVRKIIHVEMHAFFASVEERGHARRLAELVRVDGLDPATGDYRLIVLSETNTGDRS
jgi:type IV secretion system protein VirB11